MIFKVSSFVCARNFFFSVTNEIKGDAKEVYLDILLRVFY